MCSSSPASETTRVARTRDGRTPRVKLAEIEYNCCQSPVQVRSLCCRFCFSCTFDVNSHTHTHARTLCRINNTNSMISNLHQLVLPELDTTQQEQFLRWGYPPRFRAVLTNYTGKVDQSKKRFALQPSRRLPQKSRRTTTPRPYVSWCGKRVLARKHFWIFRSFSHWTDGRDRNDPLSGVIAPTMMNALPSFVILRMQSVQQKRHRES